MTTLAAPSVNQVQSTLAASFTRGTDTTIVLANGTLFPSPTPLGHVAYIHNADESKWCLVIYTSKAANTLTMGGGATDYALAKNVTVGDEAYEFPIGCIVELVCAADEIAQLFSEDGTWTKNKDAAGYDVADLGKLNFDDATELTITDTETQIANCDAAWDTRQGANVVCSADAGDKQEGTASAKMAVGVGAPEKQLLASETITSADLTGYSRIRFWIKVSANIAKGDCSLVLDDTADCASPIHILPIPAVTSAAGWTEVTLSYNPAVAGSNAVISVGLFQWTDLGAIDIHIDDIRLVKGAVTITQSYHKIDTAGGSANYSTLDTISGGVAGDVVDLIAEDVARIVMLTSGVGNVVTPSKGWVPLGPRMIVSLRYDGANWRIPGNPQAGTSGCHVILSADQALNDSTMTLVQGDVENYDIWDEYDTSTYMMTMKCSGYYVLRGQAIPNAPVDQKLILALLETDGSFSLIRKRAGAIFSRTLRRGRFYASGAALQGPNASDEVWINQGESVWLTAYCDQDGGGPTTLESDLGYAFFQVMRTG